MNANLSNAPSLERLLPLFPQLEIAGLVAVGELGATLHAVQKALDRPVALKILPEEVARDERLAEAFIAEARLLAPLTHPNLVRIFDFGCSDGLLWVIQEWLEGRTVREALADGPLSVPQTTGWLSQVCRGLEHAHAHGVIHGDLRASNLVIGGDDRVKVTNFGLGRLVMAGGGHTPAVVAPELCNPAGVADQRADVFALGVLLYEMLVGERPRGVIEPPSAMRPGLNPQFDAVVARCIEPDPADRFPDCAAFRHEIEHLVAWRAPDIPVVPPHHLVTVAPPIVRPPHRPERFVTAAHSGTKGLWVGALGALAALGSWMYVARPHNDRPAPADPAATTGNLELPSDGDPLRSEEVTLIPSPQEPTAQPPGETNPLPVPIVPADADNNSPGPAEGGGPGRSPPAAVVDVDPDPDPSGTGNEVVAEDGIEVPRPAPALADAVPRIPELERLREHLQGHEVRPIADAVCARLAGLRTSYAKACARNRERAPSEEMEFWRDELETLKLLGHPPENPPLSSPTEAKALRDGWKKNHALAVKPLDRYRDIYRGQLEKIRQEYSRRQHRRGMELLDIESAAALDPDYFLALCTGRSGRCGMLVPGNVARASLGAVASGVEKPASVNDGISNMASGQLGIPIRVELGGLLRLTRIRFELNAVDAAHYFRYHARVSPDGVHWESVCDRSQNGRWRHWQVIDFPPRAVRFIEVVGTFNSTNRNSFAIRELEAFCAAQDD